MLGASLEDLTGPTEGVAEASPDYTVQIYDLAAFREYPDLRRLLGNAWTWLSPKMRRHIHDLIVLSVEQQKHIVHLMGRAAEEVDQVEAQEEEA